jgi:hypothetical protein
MRFLPVVVIARRAHAARIGDAHPRQLDRAWPHGERRKVFTLAGLAAALAVTVPATMLTTLEAEAQTRRRQRVEERRGGRQERRTQRRTGQ